jgi:hypothetical protein
MNSEMVELGYSALNNGVASSYEKHLRGARIYIYWSFVSHGYEWIVDTERRFFRSDIKFQSALKAAEAAEAKYSSLLK